MITSKLRALQLWYHPTLFVPEKLYRFPSTYTLLLVLQSEALDEARSKFEAEKKGLHEEITFLQGKCRSALAGTALPETDERAKLAFERNRAASELQQYRAELEGVRKTVLWNEELMRRKESDLMRSLEREEQVNAERDDLKRSCESLETKVMVLEMEKRTFSILRSGNTRYGC